MYFKLNNIQTIIYFKIKTLYLLGGGGYYIFQWYIYKVNNTSKINKQ